MSQTLQAPEASIGANPVGVKPPADALTRARALAPLIEQLASAGEAEGTMPAELVAAAESAGLRQRAVPTSGFWRVAVLDR